VPARMRLMSPAFVSCHSGLMAWAETGSRQCLVSQTRKFGMTVHEQMHDGCNCTVKAHLQTHGALACRSDRMRRSALLGRETILVRA